MRRTTAVDAAVSELRPGLARGEASVAEEGLIPGTHRSTLETLADWTLWAERVLIF